jgi:hypothetical protein
MDGTHCEIGAASPEFPPEPASQAPQGDVPPVAALPPPAPDILPPDEPDVPPEPDVVPPELDVAPPEPDVVPPECWPAPPPPPAVAVPPAAAFTPPDAQASQPLEFVVLSSEEHPAGSKESTAIPPA